MKSMLSDVTLTFGSPIPSRCHVAPLSELRRTPRSLATMIDAGAVCGSITTDVTGRSGTIWFAISAVPPMSVQLVPPSVVAKTCFVLVGSAMLLKPGKTTTTWSVLFGSIAIPIGFEPGAPVTVFAVKLGVVALMSVETPT